MATRAVGFVETTHVMRRALLFVTPNVAFNLNSSTGQRRDLGTFLFAFRECSVSSRKHQRGRARLRSDKHLANNNKDGRVLKIGWYIILEESSHGKAAARRLARIYI